MLAPAFGAPKAVQRGQPGQEAGRDIDDRGAGGPQRQARDQAASRPGPTAGPAGTRRRARPSRGERRPGCQRRQGDKGDPGAPATKLWAVIDFNGTVARASGIGTGTFREDTGIYDVFFNRDVSGCAYVASLGGPDAGTPPAGTVAVTNLSDAPKGLFVITRNSAGNNASLPFHVAVFC